MANTREMYRVRVVKVIRDKEIVPLCYSGNKDNAFTMFHELLKAYIARRPTYIDISKWGKDGFTVIDRKEL